MYLSFNNCGKGKEAKNIREILPGELVTVLPETFVVEPVDFIGFSIFVVAYFKLIIG